MVVVVGGGCCPPESVGSPHCKVNEVIINLIFSFIIRIDYRM